MSLLSELCPKLLVAILLAFSRCHAVSQKYRRQVSILVMRFSKNKNSSDEYEMKTFPTTSVCLQGKQFCAGLSNLVMLILQAILEETVENVLDYLMK